MASIENKNTQWYLSRIEYLSHFMTTEREQVLRQALGLRTKYMTICAENTFHPQNASALVRHCEAFGVQDIHSVETLCKFLPNTNIVKGTDKWIDIHRHKSSERMLKSLRDNGYRIVATTPHATDCSPEDFDVTKGPFALVFGTEHAGISDYVRSEADEFIKIPMYGMVESLNVSASAAIILYILSRKIRACDVNWQLSDEERAEILFRWMTASVKDSKRILERFDQ